MRLEKSKEPAGLFPQVMSIFSVTCGKCPQVVPVFAVTCGKCPQVMAARMLCGYSPEGCGAGFSTAALKGMSGRPLAPLRLPTSKSLKQ